MTKRLTLCADDFAQSGSISAGILQLLDAGRLSATSVMSQSPHWPSLAADLKARSQRADIGLHFNLTHSFDAPAKPLSHWLMKSQLRQLSLPALRDEALAQIDRFAEHFGRLPDFVDGHQHVHALPVIRDALFDAIQRRWQQLPLPYLRAPDKLGHPGDNRLKSLILRSVCINFDEQAQEAGFATTPWFGGMYSLTPQADFSGLMQAWLARSPEQALIMCHPGLPASDADDPIAASRSREFDYLSGDAFAEHCRQHKVEIVRFQPAAVAAA
ncbi:ChbG/HpnK family deacetylase [Chromobacterium subtsugae]|uniref:ChbG/HpnK family deacetylase n=1 Tax=Chromobacterium subtsugae TaxID=251747 RepID=A0ABS7FI51_9NEIS|nr:MULTISPECIES: ChbG/HpnK family deacetylase [Chromobacterium]KUM02652.1 cellobiose phosphorylase [Chromobacterium subtsugae]KZE88039.1 cellobiose phosphorylase [Chromobacterium sp. F49]MBW7568763.1 ChbG/HpnK family deacetylase [Chromobacterium subtsugae]MBW8289760.1 ChbG/HpnK family deacetylase [Chromobacterium subtsugae]WVH59288.1 ChbG/HpnK family deacetylase [Chromobacterium subtsugae]